MATAYTKTPVGNKLFTVSWELESVVNEEINGDPFEAVDCELVSVSGIVQSGLQGFLALSNFANPSLYRNSISIDDNFLMKPTFDVRWYYPYVFSSSVIETMRISMLFREI